MFFFLLSNRQCVFFSISFCIFRHEPGSVYRIKEIDDVNCKQERKKFILYAWIREIFMHTYNWESRPFGIANTVSRRVFRLYSFCLHFIAFFHFRFFCLHSSFVWLRSGVSEWNGFVVWTFVCACVCIWKLCRIHIVFVWFNSIHLFALTILRSPYAFLRRLSCKLDHLPLPLPLSLSAKTLFSNLFARLFVNIICSVHC